MRSWEIRKPKENQTTTKTNPWGGLCGELLRFCFVLFGFPCVFPTSKVGFLFSLHTSAQDLLPPSSLSLTHSTVTHHALIHLLTHSLIHSHTHHRHHQHHHHHHYHSHSITIIITHSLTHSSSSSASGS